MFHAIRTLFDRRREARAVEALTERDLADLGMTKTQVLHFLRMPSDTPARVVAMGKIFGRKESSLKQDEAQWIKLVETCADCHDRKACALVLAKAAEATPCDAWFCPNCRRFLSMQAAPI